MGKIHISKIARAGHVEPVEKGPAGSKVTPSSLIIVLEAKELRGSARPESQVTFVSGRLPQSRGNRRKAERVLDAGILGLANVAVMNRHGCQEDMQQLMRIWLSRWTTFLLLR